MLMKDICLVSGVEEETMARNPVHGEVIRHTAYRDDQGIVGQDSFRYVLAAFCVG